MRKTIGIDVSKDFLDVASYDGSKFIRQHYDSNEEKSFKQIQSDFKIEQDDLITMEATGVYHLKLANYFLEKGYQVAVENPLRIKKYAELKFVEWHPEYEAGRSYRSS